MSSWCQVCGSADMATGDDGSHYCQSCGAQNENYIEEAFDGDDAHVFTARFVRETRVARNAEQEINAEIPPEVLAASQAFISQPTPGAHFESFTGNVLGTPYGTGSAPSQTAIALGSQFGLSSQQVLKQQPIEKEALSNSIRKSYVEGIQKILLMQIETLVKDFDVTPLICGIVGPIWLRYVASTRVFEKVWADEALEVAEDRERRRKGPRRRVFKGYEQDPEPEITEEIIIKQRGTLGPKTPRRRRQRKRQGVVEPRTTFGRKARFVWLSALKERIPLSVTLAIAYLACYVVRETVLPTDIRRWALKGKLPFLTAFVEISKPSPNHIPNTVGGLQMFPIEPKLMFKPVNVVGSRAVELLAGHVAERIGLELPSINYQAVSARLLHAMKLPVEELSVYTQRIYQWYCPAGLWLTSQETALPTRVYVMAMIVIVLKVLYSLDGRIENQTTGMKAATSAGVLKASLQNISDPGAADVGEAMQVESEKESDAEMTSQKQKGMDTHVDDIEDADGIAESNEEVNERKWKVEELISIMKGLKPFQSASNIKEDHETKLASYLKYCREVIYPGPAPDADEEVMRDHFWRIYEKKGNEATANKQPGEGVEVAINSSEEAEDGKARDKEGPRATRYQTKTHGSVGSIAGVRNKDQPRKPLNDRRMRPDHSARKSREKVSQRQEINMDGQEKDLDHEEFDSTGEDEMDVRERELQHLIKDMNKVGFSLLPPITRDVPDNAYVRYKLVASGKELKPVHEDYFIVLRVCAKLIKVHPKALHWGVQKVEQGLLDVEKNIREFMLNQDKDIAKLYLDTFGERTEFRTRDVAGEYARKRSKLLLARCRVDQGFGSERDYIDLILHADYL